MRQEPKLWLKIWKNLGTPGKGAAIGLAAMLPFVPGMIGSRKKGNELRDIYSGQEQVPIRAGRWWEVGSTAFEGARIKEWRPHWSILHKSHAEDAALYGSEEEKWKHNPVLHPDQGSSSFGLFWNHRKALPPTPGNIHIYPYI
jgi:hypothetical protein